MLVGAKALKIILGRVRTLSAENVPLELAVGRVLARNLVAREDIPPFDNSTVDGYAVRVQDVRDASNERPVKLAVQATVRAGAAPLRTLEAGLVVRIMTGAPLPPGADAVVMQEQTAGSCNGPVDIFHSPEQGEGIRARGEDLRAGSPLLKAGARIRPYEVAVLAAQGFAKVAVFRRPKVAVLSSGDELVDIGQEPGPGQIRDSNRHSIRAALARWRIETVDLGIAPDDPAVLESRLRLAFQSADAVVTSGGVSVGDVDFVKPLLKKIGVKIVFWKLAIKPGKPFLFGIHPNGKPIFGLPGNPISALVCLEEFVRPAFEWMEGFASVAPRFPFHGKAINEFKLPLDRRQYLFCEALPDGDGFQVRILRPQASHRMAMAAKANALALPPQDARQIAPGDVVPFRFLD